MLDVPREDAMTAEPIIVEAGTAHDKGHAWRQENIDDYERLQEYRDKTLAWVMPIPDKFYVAKVVDSWDQIHWPMNQIKTPRIVATDMEVGAAYEHLFGMAVDKGTAEKARGAQWANLLEKAKFILTTEWDNIIPPLAVLDLFSSLYTCIDCERPINAKTWECPNGHKGLDAVSGLYWTKCLPSRPMAYGDPKNDVFDFRPISVGPAIQEGRTIEVNGIAMGCAIFRKELFNRVSRPWFTTTAGATQDLYFCEKAKKEAGARFAVNCAVRVGHMDVHTNEVY